MFQRLKTWRKQHSDSASTRQAELERRPTAIDRALEFFKRSRGIEPMQGVSFAGANNEYIVRVMYMATHVPPDRAWFRVQRDSITELSFDEVKHIDTVA